jgi:hypothetical protein
MTNNTQYSDINTLDINAQKKLCDTDPKLYCSSVNIHTNINSDIIKYLAETDNLYILKYLYDNKYINKDNFRYTLSDALENNASNVSNWLVINNLYMNSEANLIYAGKSKNPELVKLMGSIKSPYPISCGGGESITSNKKFIDILLKENYSFYKNELVMYDRMLKNSAINIVINTDINN